MKQSGWRSDNKSTEKKLCSKERRGDVLKACASSSAGAGSTAREMMQKSLSRPLAFCLGHWSCKIACCLYFGLVAYQQAPLLKESLFSIELLVLLTCSGLAILVLIRPPAVELDARPWVLILVAYSKPYYLLLDLSETSDHTWLLAGSVVSSSGLALWVVSVLTLGRSFGILPALRRLRTRGPYAVVRHPIYASYIVVDAGLFMSFSSMRNAVVLIAAVVALFLRAHVEEALLKSDPEYRAYTKRTRFRLFPYVY